MSRDKNVGTTKTGKYGNWSVKMRNRDIMSVHYIFKFDCMTVRAFPQLSSFQVFCRYINYLYEYVRQRISAPYIHSKAFRYEIIPSNANDGTLNICVRHFTKKIREKIQYVLF